MGEFPILALDLKGYSDLTQAQAREAMTRVDELLTAAVRPLFGPMADPWAMLQRWNIGDGYYVWLRGINAHGALWAARRIDATLVECDAPDVDTLIRLRMVLGFGHVTRVDDRYEGRVLTEVGRLLDGPTLRAALGEDMTTTALAATREFHAAWELDAFRDDPEWRVDTAEWHAYDEAGKRGEVWPAFLFGREPLAAEVADDAPPPPVRIVAIVAHSLTKPLPKALEWSSSLANVALQSGRRLELRFRDARRCGISDELAAKPDLVFVYGHGDKYGQLLLNDGPAGLQDLDPDAWRDLKGCILFACHSERFATDLGCPYVVFDSEIQQNAPRGFVEALFRFWGPHPLSEAILRATEACRESMRSEFPAVLQVSERTFEPLALPEGTPSITRASPKQFGWVTTDHGSIQDGAIVYPEHDPFVGRRDLLGLLMRRIDRYSDGERVVGHWIVGAAGVGKTALTRELVLQSQDGVFAEADDPLWIQQKNCYTYNHADALVRDFAADLDRAHALETDGGLESVCGALARRPGEHLWVLDDLTYLSTRPDDVVPARRLLDILSAAAVGAALRVRLVITSRRGDESFPGLRELGPLDWREAAEMAVRLAHAAAHSNEAAEIDIGALRLHGLTRGLPALYKRTLKQALEVGQGYRNRAEEMAASIEGIADIDLDDLARAMAAFERDALVGLQKKHEFDYGRFLGAAYDLFRRAGWFDASELSIWFADMPLAPTAERYRFGTLYLFRLGFLTLEKRDDGDVFILPPNQRAAMRGLRRPEIDLGHIPFRAPAEALSMALERGRTEGFAAIGDFDELERTYGNHLEDADSAAAVLAALNVKADIIRLRPDNSGDIVKVHERILSIAGQHGENWRGQNDSRAIEQVAMGLFNMGVMHGQQDRPEAAIAAYDRLVALYAERPEAAIAEQVAMGLFNMGVMHGQQDRPEAAIAAYDRLVALYVERPEAAIAEQVAMGLFYLGVTHGQQDRPEAAIAAYDRLVALYAERPEAAIAEQVVRGLFNMGLFNMGVMHGQQDRPEAAIVAYDRLVALYVERPEAAIAEQVAMGLFNMGAVHGQQDRPEAAIAAYDRLVALYAERPEAAIEEKVAMGLFNMGMMHGQQDRPEAAIAAYNRLVALYAERPEAAIAEKVAMGLFNMGVTHGQQDRPEAAIAAYNRLVALYAERPEAAIAEQVARGLVYLGVMHGQQDRPEAAIAIYDRLVGLYAERPKTAIAEQVARGLFYLGVTHGQQDRPEAAIAAYDRLVALYAERPEAAIAEQVAMGLFYLGITHGQQDRPEAAIATYDRLVALYAEWPETAIAEQVARGLVYLGVMHGQQDRPEAAIAAYDRLVALYAERPEAAIAEQVARGLANMGVTHANQQDVAAALACIERATALFGRLSISDEREMVNQFAEKMQGDPS